MAEQMKFLGLMIHENIKWSPHIQMILKKITKYIGIFCKLRYFCPRKTLINLYYAFIYSHFIYCIEIWGNSDPTITYLKPILILQKKILRIITFSGYQAHALPLFKKLEILHIYDIFKFRISLLVYQNIHSKTNIKLEKTCLTQNMHSHNTRASTANKLFVHRYNKSFGQQSLSHKITKAWNSLPTSISSISGIRTFKTTLRQHIL
eukprot:Lithocolla_globosa_v1_NODE_932_length_3064_cov_7.400798.p2 type:complete len:206 gc:universal NODE_932_length_3064_cov_7.400798:2155-2772(+)